MSMLVSSSTVAKADPVSCSVMVESFMLSFSDASNPVSMSFLGLVVCETVMLSFSAVCKPVLTASSVVFESSLISFSVLVESTLL